MNLSKFVLIVVCLMSFACQQPAEPAPTAKQTSPLTELYIAIDNEPSSLDPHRSSEQAAAQVLEYICEPLFSRGVAPNSIYPVLAASLPEIADDGLSMTVSLREDVLFHDGTALTAEAVTVVAAAETPSCGCVGSWANVGAVMVSHTNATTITLR